MYQYGFNYRAMPEHYKTIKLGSKIGDRIE